MPNAVVEIWQANAAGRYRNPLDQRDAPLDPNFIGNGRTRADRDGRYQFFTIKPGAYPVPDSGYWWRPPHIHFSVFGWSSLSRVVTQMYFPGDPLNAMDRLILSIPDAAARSRLVARQLDTAEIRGEFLGYEHDLVLRGRAATPVCRRSLHVRKPDSLAHDRPVLSGNLLPAGRQRSHSRDPGCRRGAAGVSCCVAACARTAGRP